MSPMSPRLLRPRASGGFDPRSISGLTGWWDSQDTSTITLNGTTVSEWRDKSGNGYAMSQSVAANQPTYAANIFGTKSGVRLGNATSQRMLTNNIYMDVLGDNSNNRLTLLGVAVAPNSVHKQIGEVANAEGTGFYFRIAVTGGLAYWDSPENVARVFAAVSASVVESPFVFAGLRNGSTATFWYNGTQILTRSNASGSIKTGDHAFGIGGTSAGTTSFGEIMAYNRALTADERAQVQRYLGAKFGITVA